MAIGTAPSPTPNSPEAADSSQYDLIIRQQLARTGWQVKTVDLMAAAIIYVTGVLVFFLLAVLVDHWVMGLGFWGRLVTLFVFLGGSAYYLYTHISKAIRKINPVYAARVIEQGTPTLKNSLVNMLMFRPSDAPIHQRVMQALQQKAASDLSHVSPDASVDRAPLIKLGYLLAGVVIVCAAYKILSPKDPLQTVSRVIAPWSNIGRPSRVQIDEIQPGDKSVFYGQTEKISAKIDTHGLRTPGPVTLFYSTADGQIIDRPVSMNVASDSVRHEALLPPSGSGLQQDVTYYIVAGDAISPKYRLTVIPAPTIAVDRIELDFPGYTGRPKRTLERQGDVNALEGTRVTVFAKANQPIKSAHIEFDPQSTLPPAPGAKAVAPRRVEMLSMKTDGETASATFTLELAADRRTPKRSSYQVRFVTNEGYRNDQPIVHQIQVIPDLPPEIEILTPNQDRVNVPENARQKIEVRAVDPDFAVSKITLRAVAGGNDVLTFDLLRDPKGRSGQLVASYDFVPVDLHLKAGDEVTYWVNVEDNRTAPSSGLPEPNSQRTRNQVLRIVAADDSARPAPAADNKQDNKQDNNAAPNNGESEKSDSSKSGNSKNDKNDKNNNGNDKTDPGNTNPNNSKNGGKQGKNESGSKDGNDDGANGNPNKKSGQDKERNGDQKDDGQNSDDKSPNKKPDNKNNKKNGNKDPEDKADDNNSGGNKDKGQQQGGSKSGSSKSDKTGNEKSGNEKSGDEQQGAGQSGKNEPGKNDKNNSGNDASSSPSGSNSSNNKNSNNPTNGNNKSDNNQNPSQKPGQNSSADKNGNNPQPANGQESGGSKEGLERSDAQNANGSKDGTKNDSDARREDLHDGDVIEKVLENLRKKQQEKDAAKAGNENKSNADNKSGSETKPNSENKSGSDNKPNSDKPSGGKNSDEKSDAKPDSKTNGGEKSGDNGQAKQSPDKANEKSTDSGKSGQPEKDSPSGKQGDPDKQDKTSSGANGEKTKPDSAKPAPAGERQPPDANDGNANKPNKSTGAPPMAPVGNTPPKNDDKNKGNGASGIPMNEDGDGGKPQGPADPKGDGAGQKSGNGTKPTPGNGDNGQTGAGQDNKNAKGGSPEAQESNKDREKKGDSSPNKSDKGDEATSPSTSKKQSDSKGGKDGTESGGGGKGGGQSGNQQGNDSAGKNTPSDEGANQSDEKGNGEDSKRPGDQKKSADKTGKSGKDKGQGSGSAPADGSPDKANDPSKNAGGSKGPGTTNGPPNGGGVPSDNTPIKNAADAPVPDGDAANLEYARKATDLAIEHLKNQKDNPDRELLDKLGWSKDDLKKFLDRWESMKRSANSGKQDDAKRDLDESLRSLGLRPQRDTKRGGGATNDTQRSNRDSGTRSAPPSSYQDQFNAFRKGTTRAKDE